MITDRYHSDKHFSEFLPTSWLQKSTGTKYVTVTLCIKCGQDQNVSCSSILTGWHCLLALDRRVRRCTFYNSLVQFSVGPALNREALAHLTDVFNAPLIDLFQSCMTDQT